MAIQDIIGGICIPSPWPGNVPPVITNKGTISVANGKLALIFHAPRTGNIEAVTWRTATVTTGATIDVRLETVDTTTGDPTGTLVSTNSNVSVVVNSADDNVVFTSTFTAAGAVTAGQLVAVVFVNPGASFGSIAFAGFTWTSGTTAIPYSSAYGGASWAKAIAHIQMLSLLYDDGEYSTPFGGYAPPTLINSTAFNTTSTPDVRGLRFQFPISVRVIGAWFACDLDGDCKVMIVNTAYNQGAGTGILATVTLDANQRGSTVSNVHFVIFDTPVTLSANTNYRLVIEPTTTTSVTFLDMTVASLALLGGIPGGANFHLTTAKDPTADGDWTNYNSGTFASPFMGLIIDGIDSSGGGSPTGGSYAFTG